MSRLAFGRVPPSSRDLSRLCSAALAFALLSAPVSAFAQDAGPMDCRDEVIRGPLEVTPATGAARVTLDAIVKVAYSPDYFSIPGIDASTSFELRRCGDMIAFECETSGELVGGEIQVVGDTLFFLPARALAPNELYAGVARGVDLDLGINFRTTTFVDTGPPVLGRVDSPTTSRVDPSCEAPEGGLRVDVSFPPAQDDGSPGSIEYLLYLSRGAGIDAPELRARARNFSTELVTMAFVLSDAEAVSPACIVVHAVDGVGNVDRDMEPECFEPVQGNFFEPVCSTGGSGGGIWLVLLALWFVRRRG
ncbi:MAG: hypothetical protein AAGE52_11185 [Myxococcota bacterium]